MVNGIANFSKDLVLKFFELSFSEYGKSSIKDQMYKFSLRACSCIFSENNSISLSITDILQCIISSAAAVCKVEDQNTVLEFLELICYCANSCQTATPTVCCAVAELLGRLADSQTILPIGPIMRFYSTGLLIFSFNGQLRNGESATEMLTKDTSGSQIFCDFERLVQQIPISLDSLKDFFAIGGKGNGLSEKGAASLPSYFKALEFLCEPLAEFIYAKRRQILCERDAKESHRLRSQFFQETFKCSVDQETKCNWESADGTQKHCYAIDSFHLHNRVASGLPGDFECGILSPWMVLQCYLESTLQVGTIQEILGNGIEAETLLSWGKTIALHQCLPLYVICFSILLGKLYHKKVLWELAEKELQFASQILNENWEIISCLKCRMFLEISISQQLGDLFKDRSCASTRDPSMEMLSLAGEMYLSALHRLQLSEWKNSLSSSEE